MNTQERLLRLRLRSLNQSFDNTVGQLLESNDSLAAALDKAATCSWNSEVSEILEGRSYLLDQANGYCVGCYVDGDWMVDGAKCLNEVLTFAEIK